MNRKIVVWTTLLGIVFLLSMCFGQEEKKKPEAYSAVAMATGGVAGGGMLGFNFSINEYTSDADLMRYATLLKEKGSDGLRRELEKPELGRIYPDAGIGNSIAIARKRQTAKGTVITIVTARIMPFLELRNSGRSTDYEFGFLQVILNQAGEGTGSIIGAARIKFNKKQGQYEIESYGNQYIKVVNVRPHK
ncbi:MAG TPA: hypothetical protein VMG30_05365 [Acidobacteriota bacterium]|nr:hypothetical protein [Acidobacteriota bacterium]